MHGPGYTYHCHVRESTKSVQVHFILAFLYLERKTYVKIVSIVMYSICIWHLHNKIYCFWYLVKQNCYSTEAFNTCWASSGVHAKECSWSKWCFSYFLRRNKCVAHRTHAGSHGWVLAAFSLFSNLWELTWLFSIQIWTYYWSTKNVCVGSPVLKKTNNKHWSIVF